MAESAPLGALSPGTQLTSALLRHVGGGLGLGSSTPGVTLGKVVTSLQSGGDDWGLVPSLSLVHENVQGQAAS